MAPFIKNSDFDETLKDNVPRNIWYSTKYCTFGKFTRSRKTIDAIAYAVITAYQGIKSCSSSAPNDTHTKGSSYAVRQMPQGQNIYKTFDVYLLKDYGHPTYVATVYIQARRNRYPEEEYVTDDAIIFDRRKIGNRKPAFPRKPFFKPSIDGLI